MPKHNRRHRRIIFQPKGYTIQESFIPPEKYDDIREMPGVPDLAQFPNGIFVLGINNWETTIGYFPESQLEKMKEIARLEDEARKKMVEKEIAIAP